jgi:hypothetical protein
MVKPNQQQEQQKIQNEILRANMLRNLLTGNYAGIPEHAAELNALLARYGADKTRELITSVLDVIHDADASRDPVIYCATIPLFKLVVCNIFGISFSLYKYIHKIVPVSQRVLLRLVEGTAGYSGSKADEYFRTNLTVNPIPTCNFVRDNVGISSELQRIATLAGATIVERKTGSIILDSVSRTMTTNDYAELDTWVAANSAVTTVTNELFPGRVSFQITGSLAIGGGGYTVTTQYDPSYIQTGGGKSTKSIGWVDVKKSQPTTGVRKEKASISPPPLPNYSITAKRTTASDAADKRAAAVAAAATAPAAVTAAAAVAAAVAAAAIDRTPNQFNGLRTFLWNPRSNPLLGYRPINCIDSHDIGPFTGVPTCLPSNATKNCVFIIALQVIETAVDLTYMYAHFTAYANGVGNNVYTSMGGVRTTVSEFIQIVNTKLRNYLLPKCIQLRVNQQILTLQEYMLDKLAGDYSYKLYYINGDFVFVSTSDIILGLRLYFSGGRVLFTTKDGVYIFYNSLNTRANVVRVNLAHVVNSDIRSGVIKKLALKKNVEAAALAAASAANAAAKAKGANAPIATQVVTKFGRRSVPPPNFVPLSGGEGQKSSFSAASFKNGLKKLLPVTWLHNIPLQNESTVPSPVSPDHLNILRSVLETQFNLFKNLLKSFKEDGNKICMFLGTSNNYETYCEEINNFLECIINIMNSAECIQDFIDKCSGKSYEECDKIMCSYVLMFPFIFDTDTSSWYLNYTYPFSVCLNEYILSLLENKPENKPKDPENLDRIKKIINFVSKLKEISRTELDVTPLEYGKKMPFNVAVTFVIMDNCKKESKESLQKFIGDDKQYKEKSKLQLTKFDDTSLREFIKKLSRFIPKDTSDDTSDDEVTPDDTDNDTAYFKEIDNFFQNFVVDNNILYEDFVKELVSFLIQSNNIIREGVFSVIKFILLFQNFDNIALCSYTVIKTIIEAFLNREYSSKSFAAINNELNMLFYYNNLDIFFKDVPEVVKKIIKTRNDEGFTNIDDLSILEQNISVLTDLYGYSLDYALSKFYDELYDDSINSGHTFETTDEYVDFQMKKLQKFINEEVDKYLSYDEIEEEEEEEQQQQLQLGQQQEQPREPQQQFNPLELQHVVPEGRAVTVGTGGKNNPKSKHNTKYRKKYKKFVSKYIIKKKKNKNKSTISTSTKNKTKKNKKIAKNKSKYAKKTLKNKKRKSKSSNRKSKHNKKVNTNYYNLYKHNKTLKH